MKNLKFLFLLLIAAVMSGCAVTGDSKEDGIHKVVIQVSTNDARTQKIALNNAVNLQKAYGAGNVVVEIVAYGPGLSLLTVKNKQSRRVKSLAVDDDFTFSACNNTMNKIKKKKGKYPKLTEGVQIVPSGVARAVELQEQGYAYIRP